MEEKVPEKVALKVTTQGLWSKAKGITPLSLKISFF